MNFNVMDAAGTAATGGWGSMLIMLVVYGGLIAAMYFIFFRPQSKKKKKEAEMRKNAQVGDEVTTIGGICGRVVTIRDDSLVIETGADRNKMTIKKWAVQSCDTVHDPKEDDDDDDDDDDI